jgi:formamidase
MQGTAPRRQNDRVRVELDPVLPLRKQPDRGHNRWHPDIPPIAWIEPGEELTLELRDSLDGQLTRESKHEDVLTTVPVSHVLTGPVGIHGAERGDVLEIELLGYETDDFGWTAVLPGGGLVGDLVERPFLAKWQIDGELARSDDLPGVAIPANVFAGVIGVAPSPALMEEALRRERALFEAGGEVRMPEAETAFPPLAAEGLRTMPPRENGGNLDVRDLVAGSTLLLSVHVPGALLSAGDLHFAQGDGEVSRFAIETNGAVSLRLGLRKAPARRPRFAWFVAPPRPARACFATTGVALDDEGGQGDLDLNLAARRALLEMLDHIEAERGLSREQAMALASVAVELRISEAVNPPNPVVSALLPLDVFEN